MEYKLFIDGKWVKGGEAMEVVNKYDGRVIASVPTARQQDVDAAIAAAERAAPMMADMPAYQRAEILLRTAALIRERHDDFARTIAASSFFSSSFVQTEGIRVCFLACTMGV